MATNTIKVRLQNAFKTETEWQELDPILIEGEYAVSSDKIGDRIKIGDGTSKWSELPYETAIAKNLLTVQFNGTKQFDYNGSIARTLNITPAAIGAATTEHNHDGSYVNVTGDTMSGDLKFSSNQSIWWSNGAYQQKIAITDDSTTDTAVFGFQQSSDAGSTFTTLMTIKNNGKVVANTFVGSLSGTASNASKLNNMSVSTAGAKDVWGTIPSIGENNGVMEIGKYIDFHTTDGNTADYDARITASTTGLTLSGTTTGTFSGNLTGNVTGTASNASKVTNSLTIKLNGGSTEGTNLFTFNGSVAKTINITPSSIGASSTNHTHGLLHSSFAKLIDNTTTNSGWSMLNSTYNGYGYLLLSLRTQKDAPVWTIGDYSAGIAFGGDDTKGIMTVKYDRPLIRFAGGNGTKPVWYFTLTGTSATTYNLDTFAKKDGSNASGTWGISITGSSASCTGNAATATALASSAGSTGQPVYFTGGKPAVIDWHIGNSSVGEHNANNVTYNFCGYYTSNGPATSLGASTADGALYAQAYNSTWVAQIAQDYRNGGLYVRGKNNGTWQSWYSVLDTRNYTSYTVKKDGTGASGIWGISISGSAPKLTTARKISLGTSVTGSASFDGSSDITINVSAPTTVGGTIPYAGSDVKNVTVLTDFSKYRSYLGSTTIGGTWYNLISVRHRNGASDGTSYGLYLQSKLTSTGDLIWNKQYGASSWQGERTILDSSNYTSYTVKKDGTGASGAWGISITGNASTATKLTTARTIRTNLGSTSTASFDGSANITPGVTGTLPIANGGTGATTAAGILTNAGLTATAAELNYMDGVTSNVQTQINTLNNSLNDTVNSLLVTTYSRPVLSDALLVQLFTPSSEYHKPMRVIRGQTLNLPTDCSYGVREVFFVDYDSNEQRSYLTVKITGISMSGESKVWLNTYNTNCWGSWSHMAVAIKGNDAVTNAYVDIGCGGYTQVFASLSMIKISNTRANITINYKIAYNVGYSDYYWFVDISKLMAGLGLSGINFSPLQTIVIYQTCITCSGETMSENTSYGTEVHRGYTGLMFDSSGGLGRIYDDSANYGSFPLSESLYKSGTFGSIIINGAYIE